MTDHIKNEKEERDEISLEWIEDKLIREEQDSKKIPMPVSGRSVFEIVKAREKRKEKKK